ncbi:nucleophile aminohydrolase [Schizophyllum commune]
MPLFIAVHGGAGRHAVEDRKATKQALKTETDTVTTDGEVDAFLALSPVEAAIRVLEDDPILNAGYGSNLTEAGTVECDAAIMSAFPIMSASGSAEFESNALAAEFGSVAAAPGIRNPISAARAVLQNTRRVDVLGRVPPLTLCGHGARDFARAHGVEVVPEADLVSDRARADWEYWTAQLRGEFPAETLPTAEGPTLRKLDAHQDTVGAVCFGGLLLKHPGRIGEAAVYGAGCWAGPIGKLDARSTGEAIMRANLARRISEELDRAWDAQGQDRILDVHQILYDVLKKEFGSHGQAVGWDGCDKPTVGVLVMLLKSSFAVRLYSAFTAAGMAVAYARDNVSLAYQRRETWITVAISAHAPIFCRRRWESRGLSTLRLILCTRVPQMSRRTDFEDLPRSVPTPTLQTLILGPIYANYYALNPLHNRSFDSHQDEP